MRVSVGTGEAEVVEEMGEKYAVRGLGSKSAIARQNAKIVLPLCALLVLFVWNSPTLTPFDGASSGPVHDMVVGEHEAMSSQYTTVQDEESNSVYNGRTENDSLINSQDEIISAQYDSLMSQMPTQITHEETRSADITTEETRPKPTESKQEEIAIEEIPGITREETRPEPTESKQEEIAIEEIADITREETRPEPTEPKEEEIAIEEIPMPSAHSVEAMQQSPAEFEREQPSPQSEEIPAVVSIAPVRAEEASRNSTIVETQTQESPVGTEMPKSKDKEPFVDYSLATGDRNDVMNTAIWKKFEEVRAVQLPYYTRKENFNNGDGESCDGRYIYVYDLPSAFNADLAARCDSLFPWLSLCDFFMDSGRGTPVNAVENGTQIFVPGDRWFNTHQYALELVSHARILKYKCRTDDPNQASLFYIPYYAGLDVIRWHFQPNATNDRRDELALSLYRWLEEQAPWRKNGGRDHVLVLGKISWDFRRQSNGMWGSRLLEFPWIQQTTKVMIERDPWATNDIGVPHPTYFHPQSAADIDTWLGHVRSQSRTSLVTFVGKERKNDPTNVRTALVQQCRNSSDCRFVECVRDKCLQPAYVTKAFMATHFCMQPVGDSPTRRSVFDSLIAGCIPVLFHPCTAYVQYPWHLPANESTWSVYISEDAIRDGSASVVETLNKISVAQRDAMRENIINNVIPGLIYSAPGSDVSPYRDAFDITVEQLLYRVKHRPPLAKSQVVPAPV